MDDVFFGCVAPEYERARKMACAAMRDTKVVDPDLVKVSDGSQRSPYPQIQGDLAALDRRLNILHTFYNESLSGYMKDEEKTAAAIFSAMLQQC